MSRKSRRHSWFSKFRPQSPPPTTASRSVEEQEFVVEADVADLQPVGASRAGGIVNVGASESTALVDSTQLESVGRFDQPEFSDPWLDDGVQPTGQSVGRAKSAVQSVAVDARSSQRQVQRPLKQRIKRRVKAGVVAGQQASINGAKSAARFAKGQALGVYDRAKPVVSRHRWSLLSLSLLTAASVTSLGAVIWLSRVPPAPKCDQINILSSDSERLYCAQQAANTGDPTKLLAAIDLVKGWSEDHPMYPQATSALGQWSEMLLLEARGRLGNNDLDGAVKLAQQIPQMSPIFKRAQEEIEFWQSERNRAKKLFDKIQTALRKQYWNEASGLLAKLALVDDATWQNRLPNLRKQLNDEKKAGQFLKQAKKFAKQHPVSRYGEAIQLTLPMNRQTFVWATAQKQIEQWRDQLLKLAAEKLKAKDNRTANRLIASLPPEIEITEVQRDLLRVVQVAQVSRENQNRQPVLNQLWNLMVADTATNQVTASSPFHRQIKQLRPQLKMQATDVVQLSVARALAETGQLAPLNWAMQQVEQVGPKRPRRIQAQTLLADWRKRTQALEDRPVLKQAELLANAGGLGRLRSAVALVNRIPKGRSIYGQAQTQKRDWITQIQTIEDQPILAEARSLAEAGKLGKAITVARRIKSGRALYSKARDDIWGWSAELQVIADRNRLARANSLAAQGSLSRAINVASQISSRSVAGAARPLINRWVAERAAYRRAQAPAPERESTTARARVRRRESTRRYEPRPASRRYEPAPRRYEPAPRRYQPPAPAPAPYVPPAPAPVAPPPPLDPVPPADPLPPQ